VWLDPGKTSPYRFYQFFVQAEDATDYLGTEG
jgi:tyrosyl-tRNA synthetase